MAREIALPQCHQRRSGSEAPPTLIAGVQYGTSSSLPPSLRASSLSCAGTTLRVGTSMTPWMSRTSCPCR